MMRSTVWFLALVAACGPSAPEIAANLQPKLNEPFTLDVGQTAVFFEPALVIRFTAVPQDSRCPSNVVCIWAGDGVASLDLHAGPRLGDGPDFQVDLHTTLQPNSTPWGPYYEIRLVSLDPYPVYGASPEPYRATLIVESH